LEIYLNVAESADGIFGIKTAARHYFHKRAGQLDAREGALLATSLPNPIKRNAAHPTPFQQRIAGGVGARILTAPQSLTHCLTH
jgi:monofunctional biosynthetic peptidoglycan transglycosylase